MGSVLQAQPAVQRARVLVPVLRYGVRRKRRTVQQAKNVTLPRAFHTVRYAFVATRTRWQTKSHMPARMRVYGRSGDTPKRNAQCHTAITREGR